jgi:hypothetical protein
MRLLTDLGFVAFWKIGSKKSHKSTETKSVNGLYEPIVQNDCSLQGDNFMVNCLRNL